MRAAKGAKVGTLARRVGNKRHPAGSLADPHLGIVSSGPARLAIEHAGESATRQALAAAFAGSRQPDGSYRQDNAFRYLIARA